MTNDLGDIETGKKFVFKSSLKDTESKGHNKHILSVAVSSDKRYVASAGRDKLIKVWDTRTNSFIDQFPGHQDDVTCLAFQLGTHQLYSGSLDRTVKVWDVKEMSYIDTLYGHEGHVNAIDSMYHEAALSCGNDSSCRFWKIIEER